MYAQASWFGRSRGVLCSTVLEVSMVRVRQAAVASVRADDSKCRPMLASDVTATTALWAAALWPFEGKICFLFYVIVSCLGLLPARFRATSAAHHQMEGWLRLVCPLVANEYILCSQTILVVVSITLAPQSVNAS